MNLFTKDRLLTLLAFLITINQAFSQKQVVQFSGKDGFVFTGYLWNQQKTAPGILLLHQCDSDQMMYESLGNKLHKAGFNVMSFDYRGIGKSVNNEYNIKEALNARELWDKIAEHNDNDLKAVYEYFKNNSKNTESIGVLGASCGGGRAITLALDYTEIKALAFFSCRLSEDAVSKITNSLNDKPMFFIASEQDRRAFDTAMVGFKASTTDNTRLITYKGADHGFPLFTKDKNLEDNIVKWFETTIKQ